MSNDLISRKALMDAIKKWLPKDPCGQEQSIEEKVATDLSVSMLMEIEEAPTAYDVDAVCEELEEELRLADKEKERCIKENQLQFDSAKGYSNGIANAIDIVRNGGMKG